MRPFQAVVEEHGASVLRVCRAIVGPVDADDAWSETFLSALSAYETLTPNSDVRAWLVTIAHRKAIDILRARSRAAVPVGVLQDQPSTTRVLDVQYSGLWSTVAELPDRQRLAVAYHYLGGLSHSETAKIIGGSVESVRRASSDGVARLRRQFSDIDAEPAMGGTKNV